MSVNSVLTNQRQLASESSKGISCEAIYRLFEQRLIQLDLKGDLLDFGAGTGNLTQRLQALNRFSSITAIDMMQRPLSIDQSIKWVSWDLNEITNIPDQVFDVIISSEVIEHLENPRAVFREWFRLLRPNGKLIFSTPNNESLRSILALIFQGHFVYFVDSCYPAHITALVRKDIKRILQEIGFDKPQFVFTDIGGIPKLPYLKWQSISFGRLRGLRFSDNLMVIASKNI